MVLINRLLSPSEWGEARFAEPYSSLAEPHDREVRREKRTEFSANALRFAWADEAKSQQTLMI